MQQNQASNQSPGSKKPPPVGLHLKRPCMLVADLERAFTLYRDVLGFQVDYLSEEAGPDSYLYKVFQIPAVARLKFASLSTDNEARALALAEVKGIELPPRSLPHSIGLVIQVEAITPVLEQVVAMGLSIVEPNHFTAPPNLEFTEQGIYDFDGQLIVLYETRVVEPLPST
ncbi:VOC family protein [filamentous cyanobacterium LEGE 11480]|uniref:VOC family protein n=1 Tax=Romeriopsis navalis LEGE 11480 TaxID=2777977 RepID=A0A928Z5Y1_9CYAN|nr:VOC family protein [Romeriopsis navalis]MBE9032462.1 VOC family protein [Romeriopsis navalis LEGE 11480]